MFILLYLLSKYNTSTDTTPTTPTARRRHSDVDTGTDVAWDKVVNVFKFFFFFFGVYYGIKGSVDATKDDLGPVPGVNIFLAQSIPLAFYKSFPILLLTAGAISQTGINLGLSLDIATEFFKCASRSNNLKNFLLGINTKNSAHVVGALLGLGSAITYMSQKNAHFPIPFNAAKNAIFLAPFLLAGACSNSCAYAIDGVREVLYGLMAATNKLGPKLVRLTPCPTFNLEGYNPDVDVTFANLFKMIGGLIGTCLAINGSYQLTEKHVEFPYVDHETAAHLQLGFYKFTSAIFISGQITNYLFHFGLALDKLIELVKTFPLRGSMDDFKNWFFKYDMKDASHVVGMMFGLVLSSIYIKNDVKSHPAWFRLPYEAETGVPELFMQILMIFYLSGAFANAFSFFTDALRQAVKGGKAFMDTARKTVSSVLPFSIFSRSTSSTLQAPPLPIVMPSPIPISIPNYATPGALYRKN